MRKDQPILKLDTFIKTPQAMRELIFYCATKCNKGVGDRRTSSLKGLTQTYKVTWSGLSAHSKRAVQAFQLVQRKAKTQKIIIIQLWILLVLHFFFKFFSFVNFFYEIAQNFQIISKMASMKEAFLFKNVLPLMLKAKI